MVVDEAVGKPVGAVAEVVLNAMVLFARPLDRSILRTHYGVDAVVRFDFSTCQVLLARFITIL